MPFLIKKSNLAKVSIQNLNKYKKNVAPVIRKNLNKILIHVHKCWNMVCITKLILYTKNMYILINKKTEYNLRLSSKEITRIGK